ncbi:T-complex protein 1 subunit gamma [Hanseniaspora opuntiae]
MQAPVVHINTPAQTRTHSQQAQQANIQSAKTISEIIKTCLGPKAMLKLLLDPMGGIVLTNDGNAILREIEVVQPGAKFIIDLAKTQDDEVGDGTTSVILLTGEILSIVGGHYLLERKIHPVVINKALKMCLKDALDILKQISNKIDTKNDQIMIQLIKSSLGTKYMNYYANDDLCRLSLDAVRLIKDDVNETIDIKRYVKVEKIVGGDVSDSKLIKGSILNKDVVHPSMKRHVKDPKIILLDCPLEYKKGESQTNIEITNESDWNRYLEIEEEQVIKLCETLLEFKPDVVITEKGVSDLAQHYLMKGGVSVLRRVKKSDLNRLSKVTGATIVNRVDDLKESDIGTDAKEFKVELIGDEYYTYVHESEKAKACTVLLRGPSKDILNELMRNIEDSMAVVRNILTSPYLCPGGGATEMALSVELGKRAEALTGIEKWPYQAIADALECIPRTLIQNSGGNPIKLLSQLRAKHANGDLTYGIDGEAGKIVDMKSYGIWEPELIKQQTLKTSIEASCMLLRVDDIVSAIQREQ